MLYKGSSEIQKVYLGSTPLSAIYHGINKIYPKDQPVPPGPGPEPAYGKIILEGDTFYLDLASKHTNLLQTYSRASSIHNYQVAYSTTTLPGDYTAVNPEEILHERITDVSKVATIRTTSSSLETGNLWIGKWYNGGKKFVPTFALCDNLQGYLLSLVEYRNMELNMEPTLDTIAGRTIFSPIRPGGSAQTPDDIVGASQAYDRKNYPATTRLLHPYEEDGMLCWRIQFFDDFTGTHKRFETTYRSSNVWYDELPSLSVVWSLIGGVRNRRDHYGFFNAEGVQTWDPSGWLV